LRTGAGLVHIAVRSEVLAEAVPRAPIDAMVLAAGDGASFSALLEKSDVVAIGPGLGTDYDASELIRRILGETKAPLLIDADALTLLAKHADLLAACRGRAILTPHPGEMGRFPGLGGKFGEAERPEVARQFVAAYGVVLLLKGTRTLVAAPGEPLAVNATGNPGLAAGGSGDLLTGIVASLVGQGLALADAARLGAWLHGRAADLALRARGAEEGLGPLEVADHLAAAFADLRS
jgi:NAD(P)H-hydrate epimerase